MKLETFSKKPSRRKKVRIRKFFLPLMFFCVLVSVIYFSFFRDDSIQKLEYKKKHTYFSASFDPNSDRVVVNCNGPLTFLKFPSLEVDTKLENIDTCLTIWSPSGEYLAISNYQTKTELEVWNMQSQKLQYTIPFESNSNNTELIRINSVNFDSTSKLLAVSWAFDKVSVTSRDVQTEHIVSVFNSSDGSLLYQLPNFKHAIFLPNGREMLMIGSAGKEVLLYNLETQKVVTSYLLEGDNAYIGRLTISSDGKLFAMESDSFCKNSGRCIEVWDIQKHSKILKYAELKDALGCLVFSPKSDLLVWGYADYGDPIERDTDNPIIEVFSMQEKRVVRQLKGHSSNIWSIAFNRDGKNLVSTSSDGTLRLWKVEVGLSLWGYF